MSTKYMIRVSEAKR